MVATWHLFDVSGFRSCARSDNGTAVTSIITNTNDHDCRATVWTGCFAKYSKYATAKYSTVVLTGKRQFILKNISQNALRACERLYVALAAPGGF